MKKAVSFFAALILALLLCGCGTNTAPVSLLFGPLQSAALRLPESNPEAVEAMGEPVFSQADHFTLFGREIDRNLERLEFTRVWITDDGLDQIRDALDLMPHCTYLKLDDCGTSDEAMAALREEYEGRVKVVWRVHFGKFSDLTDTKIIHAVAPEQYTELTDRMCRVLKYCTETEYIDLGHDPLTNIEFCRYMPNLKLAILSFNRITDLSPLENCPELYMLELCSCRYLKDLSPLENCENLELLNFSYTAVTDITPLYGLQKLKLLDGAMNEIPQEQIDEITQLMPNCRMTFEGIDTHEVGWRKEYNGKYYDWYLEVREIFGYARNDFSGKSW